MSTSSTAAKRIYRITFLSQGQVYEIYARQVSQGGLFGFIEVEELLFGERTELVVDPSEESLRREFQGVRRTYLPLHAVLRIDEVEKEGTPRITATPKDGGKVASFPVPVYAPGTDRRKK